MLLANPITAKAFPPTITQISPKRLARENRPYKAFEIVKNLNACKISLFTYNTLPREIIANKPMEIKRRVTFSAPLIS